MSFLLSLKTPRQREADNQQKHRLVNMIRPHCVRIAQKWAVRHPWCQVHHSIHEHGLERMWWELHLVFTPNGVAHFTEEQIMTICDEVPARIRDVRSDILVKRLGWGTKETGQPRKEVVWMVKLKQ